MSDETGPVHKPENRKHQQDAGKNPQPDKKSDLLLMR
jgi:hypothetical protein